ncbi:hypothetical protein QKU48_gp0042 [Fadolivirus algeromassiliense]|jgi:hypothetical protein|uniref:LicD family protein n=1 Tax=Fadolivirus FV1/VV64 TaxID=3070911 RepID=A0A7D3QWC8_9VIRU|nr:hypothetical protein QKU48_gp0042 [Fadolivirus algeromassiliense]QKF93500.1 hypothetical protein Fadolivirus_1_42 [Fadolivirus FV1/VV64]
MNITDKYIQKIYNDTISNYCIDINKINIEQLETILNSCFNPIFIATLWKLYHFLYERSRYSKNLFWGVCGNTVGYFKYHGHIPWDDDIDIGFEINNNFDEYVDFLIECIKNGFIINLHIKKEDNDKLNWYENNVIVNLVLDSYTPTWSHIKESEFRQMMINNPSKLFFANVTLNEQPWLRIAKQMGLNEFYKWDNKFTTTPWIDVAPYFKKNNQLIPNVNDIREISPNLSTEFEYHNFMTIPGKFPIDLLEGILQQYNSKRTWNNFMHWDTIYSHIKKTKIIVDYNLEQELHRFIRLFIQKYNDHVLNYMKQISLNDLV